MGPAKNTCEPLEGKWADKRHLVPRNHAQKVWGFNGRQPQLRSFSGGSTGILGD